MYDRIPWDFTDRYDDADQAERALLDAGRCFRCCSMVLLLQLQNEDGRLTSSAVGDRDNADRQWWTLGEGVDDTHPLLFRRHCIDR